MEEKRQIVRSSRPRLSERKVVIAPKEEANTASLSRLTENTRPKMNVQQSRRCVKVLRLPLKSKLSQTLQDAFNRIYAISVSHNGKQHIISYRLKKLFSHVTADQKGVAFRRILLTASTRYKKYYEAGRKSGQTALSRAGAVLFTFLDSKMKEHQRDVVWRFIANKKLHRKVELFAKLSKLSIFMQVLKTKLMAGLLKIQSAAAATRNRGFAARILRHLEGKSTLNKQFAFSRLQKRVADTKQAAAAASSQAEKVAVEEAAQQPAQERPAVDRKLQLAVTKLQNETTALKQKLDRELEQKQRRQKELESKLEEFAKQNQELAKTANSQSRRRSISPPKPSQAPEREPSQLAPPKSQVYESIFTNLLFFLKNAEETIPKEKILENLLLPMSRIDMPIETIRMENEVLEEVLEHYRKLKLKLPPRQQRPSWFENKPYEYLLKENRELYQTLKELVDSVDPSKKSKALDQLVRDFQVLQRQLASKSPSRS